MTGADTYLHGDDNTLSFEAGTVAEEVLSEGQPAVVVDLGATSVATGGAIWSLPHGGDLDANLVRLGPGDAIGEHVNREVDVLLLVQSGTGQLTVGDDTYRLRGDVLALVPRGARRSVAAAAQGITYLSVHRRRALLSITSPTDRSDHQEQT
jgi:quercetin dioxygenase-like cupin family protein